MHSSTKIALIDPCITDFHSSSEKGRNIKQRPEPDKTTITQTVPNPKKA